MALQQSFDSALAAEIEYSPTPLRLWTGSGNLTFDGDVYSPGKLLSASESSVEAEEPRQYASFDLSLTLAADRMFHFNEDRGPTPCSLHWLWRADSEDDWKSAVAVAGRVGESNYVGGVLTIQIQQVLYDVDKGQTVLMDNATQQRLYPGDLGFEYSAQIAARGGLQQKFPWPP